MSTRRGAVVLVDFPFSGGVGGKVRPALVVQNDLDNQRLTNTIIAMITGQTKRALEPTQLLIDIATPDGALTGLRKSSVVNCVNLFTVEQAKILQTIGRLSATLLGRIDGCLKAALGLP
jgi:mRNA interferase MazF